MLAATSTAIDRVMEASADDDILRLPRAGRNDKGAARAASRYFFRMRIRPVPRVQLPVHQVMRHRRLMWHGILLFLLGLLTGLVQNALRNPRMGLAAHLEGLMNGTFLLALGAAWNEVRLSARAAQMAFSTALFGAYANWAVSLLAAALGTSAMTPIAGSGFNAHAWQ